MELNDEEILELLNRLLERMQRAGHANQGSKIELVYVAPGAQHVDHVENQNISTPSPFPSKARLPVAFLQKEREFRLPEVLASKEAMALWEKAQEVGYVDANYQPQISRTQAALLADMMAERLGIREKWKVFETLWKRKYMRSDYNLALTQQQSLDFQDELKRVF